MLLTELLLLKPCEVSTNFDDLISCAVVNFRVAVLDIVEYVERESAIPCTNLIDDEIFVWEVLEQIFREQALSNSLAIPRLFK